MARWFFFILVLSTKYICHTFRLIWYVPRELGPHSSRTTAVVFGAQSCGGGGSVSEVVSLYVVGIRWPPITPTAQSVHSAPTQYAHASTYVQQLSFKEKTSIAGTYILSSNVF